MSEYAELKRLEGYVQDVANVVGQLMVLVDALAESHRCTGGCLVKCEIPTLHKEFNAVADVLLKKYGLG